MLHRARAGLLVVVLAATACSRDLSLPAPPAASQGSLSGTVVVAQPGLSTKQPASGARIELLGTGRIAFADAQGRFVLANLDATASQLLIQFDPMGTGVPSRQKVLDLGAFGVRPGLQVSIGEVTVSENARLTGKILRADAAGPGGNAGTIVYVPQGPFTTFTNDDGSFVLDNLPEGSLSVAAFRTGYQSAVVDGVDLRPGEDFTLRDLTLFPLSGGGTGDPGSISGKVVLDSPGGSGTTALVAVDGAGTTYSSDAASDGTFTIAGVMPGVYQVSAIRAGFGVGRVSNVAVAPAQTATIPDLHLSSDGGSACVPNAPCQTSDQPCQVGTSSCSGGQTCVPVGNAIDGTACGSGKVCQAGACVPYCDTGRICPPSNLCHVGVVICAADGTPLCTDIGANLPDGYACAPGQSCSAGDCVACTGSGCGACSVQCVPPTNPCKVGARSCATGSGCTETALDVVDGTGCGTNQVCLAGACVPCSAGAGCETTSDPCKSGVVSCNTGYAVCVAGSNKADGTPCGSGDTCRTGVCVPAGGQVQTLYSKTPVGSQSLRSPQVASNGDVYFVDTYDHTVKRIPAGGGAPVVIAGQSGQPGASADNQPATSAKLYYPTDIALDESAGLLYVSDTYNNRVRAIQLTGTNRWILNIAGGGTSTGPAYGDGGPAACDPLNPNGCTTLSYPDGIGLGTDGGKKYLYVRDESHARFRRVDLAAGSIDAWSLDTNCNDPVAFSDCSGNPCGLASAGSGGMFVSGRICGTRVGGTTFGIVRVPPGGGPLVHVAGRTPGLTTEGGFSRATSFPDTPGLAVDAASNLYTAQLAGNVIRRISPLGVVRTVAGTGAASSLGDGGAATDASFDGPVSIDFARGGTGKGIDAIVTEARDNVVRSVVGLGSSLVQQGALAASGGTPQTAVIGMAPPSLLQAQLTDSAGAALVGFTVSAAATSSPAGYLGQSSASTDVNGNGSFGVRAGLLPGTYTFQISYQDLFGKDVAGSPVSYSVTATEPPAGTIFTVLNEDRSNDFTGLSTSPSFGPVSHMSYPWAVASGPDGTVYVSTYYHRVLAIAPDGSARIVAGNASAGFNGDGGLAALATLYYPQGLALDDAGTTLFIADQYNNRVRAVDLQTGLISTIAGNGTPTSGGGDGGPASASTIYYPSALAQRGGKLYVGENGPRIRVIDLTASPPTIDTVLVDANTVNPPTACSGTINFRGCAAGNWSCGLAIDPAGALYVSGYGCGTATGSSTVFTVLKWDGVSLTYVAGQALSGSSDADGMVASRSYFGIPPALAYGPGSRLFLADIGGHRVRYIDLSGSTPTNRLWFGSGVAGFAGSYASTTLVPDRFNIQLNQPAGIAFTPSGHAVVADYNNHSLRLVWKAASALP